MNSHIGEFFNWLLRSSWQASLLVLLVFAAQWIFRKKLSARWHHALWLLVLARLVLPVSVPATWSIFNYTRLDRLGAPEAVFAPMPQPMQMPGTPQSALELAAAGPPVLAERPAASTLTVPPRTSSPVKVGTNAPQNWKALGAIAWLTGVMFLAIRLIAQIVVYRRKLRDAQAIEDAEILALLAVCAKSLGVTTTVRLEETTCASSPSLYGLIRPRLLLPTGMTGEFAPGELRHVFLHELAHVKRRDMAMQLAAAFVQILHWFNPLLWFAFRRMAADRELACDELALSCAGESERRAYGEMVLKLLEQCKAPVVAPGVMGILEEKSQMRRRILGIARFKPARRWSLLAIGLTAALGLVALTDAKSQRPQTTQPAAMATGHDTVTNQTIASTQPKMAMTNGGTLEGVVLLPDGKPAGGAEIGLLAQNEDIFMKGNTLGRATGHPSASPIARTDAEGRFTVKTLATVTALVTTHEQGYINLPVDKLNEPLAVHLEPWGKIEGTIHVGHNPGTNEQIMLSPRPERISPLHVFFDYQTADQNGHFEFTHVPPGKMDVARVVRFGVTSVSTGEITVSVKPGETTSVELGGSGRQVTARLVKFPGADYDWNQVEVELRGPQPAKPGQPNRFVGAVADDGVTHIDNVPSGEYTLTVFVDGNKPGSHEIRTGWPGPVFSRFVEIPAFRSGPPDRPMDLGVIKLEKRGRPNDLKAGDAVPLIQASDASGNPIKLSDFRGKYVLLVFSRPSLDNDPVFLEAVRAAYGKDNRLMILNLNEDFPNFGRPSQSATNPDHWVEAYGPTIAIPGGSEEYFLAQPDKWNSQILLIGPDGKVLASPLHGASIRNSVAAVLPPIANANSAATPGESRQFTIQFADGQPAAGATVALIRKTVTYENPLAFNSRGAMYTPLEYPHKTTDRDGRVWIDTFNIQAIVLLDPEGFEAPMAQTVQTNSGGVTFSVSANGTAPLTYQWLFNGAATWNNDADGLGQRVWPGEAPAAGTFVIHKWAKITGTLYRDGKIAPNEQLSLAFAQADPLSSLTNFSMQVLVNTDGNGRFQFDYAPPGKLEIRHQYIDQHIGNVWQIHPLQDVEVKPGETKEIEIRAPSLAVEQANAGK